MRTEMIANAATRDVMADLLSWSLARQIRRRGRKHLPAVGRDEALRDGHLRTCGRARSRDKAGHRHLVADLERRALPTIPHEDIRAGHLEIPARDIAPVVLFVDVEPRVRIG